MPFLAHRDPPYGGRVRTMGARWKWALGLAGVAGAGLFFLSVDVRPHEEYIAEAPLEEAVVPESAPLPPKAYGIPMDGFTLERGTVRPGATFGDLLAAHGVPMGTAHALVERARPGFDTRRMRSGHAYAFVFRDDEAGRPAYFVYESDAVEYFVFGIADTTVRKGRRPVRTTEHAVSCTVTGALYNDLARAGADPGLALALSEVFAWTVDFHRLQKDDVFTVVYAQRTVDGKAYGAPRVLAARYGSGGRTRQAFRFGQDGDTQYFDDEGNSLRKAFLKAPLKFSRISSGFSGRRLHPVQKVMKAHLGTDYAAPYGTPILAVGDGTVEVAGHGSGNGNFVKIRHNAVYGTQYLHMRRILVKQGQRVQQGDVIGEVGSTGLATGPHVCFRFWKNGVQVDHRREEFPSAEPVAEAERPAFERLRGRLTDRLDEAEFGALQERLARF